MMKFSYHIRCVIESKYGKTTEKGMSGFGYGRQKLLRDAIFNCAFAHFYNLKEYHKDAYTEPTWKYKILSIKKFSYQIKNVRGKRKKVKHYYSHGLSKEEKLKNERIIENKKKHLRKEQDIDIKESKKSYKNMFRQSKAQNPVKQKRRMVKTKHAYHPRHQHTYRK